MKITSAECTIPAAIGALASVIAKELSDEDLAFLAAAVTQLGDSLATVAAIRPRCTKPATPETKGDADSSTN
jgi:hypothetical protein